MSTIKVKVFQPETLTTVTKKVRNETQEAEILKIENEIQALELPEFIGYEVNQEKIQVLQRAKQRILDRVVKVSEERQIPEMVLPTFEIEVDGRKGDNVIGHVVGSICRDIEKLADYYKEMNMPLFNGKAPVFMEFEFGGTLLCISGKNLDTEGSNGAYYMKYIKGLRTSLKYGSTPKARIKFAKHVWAAVKYMMQHDECSVHVKEYIEELQTVQNAIEVSTPELVAAN